MTSIAWERAQLARVGLTQDKYEQREKWGAQIAKYLDDRAVVIPATSLWFHIAVVDDPSDLIGSERQVMRNIERIGWSRFPNTGYSYNWATFNSGVIMEGQPLTRRGAHTYNDLKRRVCVEAGCVSRGSAIVGGGADGWNLNYTGRALVLPQRIEDVVTDVQVDQAGRVYAAMKLSGLVTLNARLHGHRCCANKNCPGNQAWARLSDVNDAMADWVRRGHVAEGGYVSATGPEKWDAADWAMLKKQIPVMEAVGTPMLSPAGKRLAIATWPSEGANPTISSRYLTELAWVNSVVAATKLAEVDAELDAIPISLATAVQAIMAKIDAGEANDLTADEVRSLLANAVVSVDVTVKDETPS